MAENSGLDRTSDKRGKFNEAKQQNSYTVIRHPAFLGAVIGILAAFAQALLISAGGPVAYGFCIAGHTRDLINGIVNSMAATTLFQAPISQNAILPVMSVIGVLIGGYLSARKNREHKIKKSTPMGYLAYFIGGVLVIQFTGIFGGCPYRAALRTAYGDLTALLFIITMALGVVLAAIFMLKQAEKEDI